ncbi:general stress protein [Actinoplanes sichuanensis]|uniref:General stress protein n=1 Tax=Actinoplanes sichuanensis TaxID=512349 RepID=A0ABW4A162_9ACTN
MTTTALPLPAELPTTTATVVGNYPTYAAAQHAVDHLSDRGFPVQHVTIVGVDLRLVETVTGRLTVPRAALAGAGGGAWIGLLAGAMLALFTTAAWPAVVAVAVLGGAVWGAVMAAVAHAATRGRRDFASHRRLAAARYHLAVATDHADDANRLLTQHAEVMQYTWYPS